MNRPRLPHPLQWEAAIHLVVAVVALRILRQQRCRRLLHALARIGARRCHPLPRPRQLRALLRAIRAGARRLPGASGCLPQALAAQGVLARRRLPARVAVGVRDASPATGGIDAHAWVELRGRVVFGGPADAFHPLWR